ncbi:MAG TPA: acyltransferase [Pseudolabrys sp.]|nr:acyltransferase [Pseudolabrys sp.]
MGLLRTIFALLVVGSHLGAFGGATFAVKGFFIISGFYMALVISTRYYALPVSDFYASRLLRLLPLYWVVGLLTVAAEILLVPPGQQFHKLVSPVANIGAVDLGSLPFPTLAYVVVSVSTMAGLDTGQWLGFDRVGGQLSLAPFGPNATTVVDLSPVPPGWTIGLELLFYFIAPFVVRRSIWFIAGLCIFSLGFRVALMMAGFSGYPWSRSLFPSELIYFLLGVLAYRLYLIIPDLRFSSRTQACIAVMVLIVAVIYWPIDYVVRGSLIWNTLPYVLIAAGIPFLFRLTKDNAIDANIGELSYPIYLCHLFIIGLVQWSPLNNVPTWPRHIFTIILVIVAAFLLDRLLVLPLDRLRLKFGAKARIVSGLLGQEASPSASAARHTDAVEWRRLR